MNIKTSNVENQKNIQNSQNNPSKSVQKGETNFSDELKELENSSEIKNNKEEITHDTTDVNTADNTDFDNSCKNDVNPIQDSIKNQEKIDDTEKKQAEYENDEAINKKIIEPQTELNEQIQQKKLMTQQNESNEQIQQNNLMAQQNELNEQIQQKKLMTQQNKSNEQIQQNNLVTQQNESNEQIQQNNLMAQQNELKEQIQQNNLITQQNELKDKNTEQYTQNTTLHKNPFERNADNIYTEVTGNKDNEETIPNNKEIDHALENLTNVFKQLNKEVKQTDELNQNKLKITDNSDDKNNEDNSLINNDFNITDKDKLTPQMNLNMHFSGDGQPFSSLMNDEQNNGNKNNILGNSQKELEEEAIVLSTMEENVEIANKNTKFQGKSESKEFNSTVNIESSQSEEEPVKERTVARNDGIKKINVQSGVTIETVVKYDNIIMNEADVEVFANLVQNNEVNLNNLTTEVASKTTQVSKTLADMLAKAQETNQPLRIDFDNDISVIIRISRDGKLSADFLPSSQIAETYIKENLSVLRQRFDENNIEYDELNQRDSRDRNRENNKRKDRNNE